MNEHEPRPAEPRDGIDWRRLDVAVARFAAHVADGIAEAHAESREVDDGTARMMAHALGRAYGRQSALADFGRTGEGHYLTLRDEYLDLYNRPEATPTAKEWIDWLGTYLVQRDGTGTGRTCMNEHLPPQLDRLLVRTSIRVGDARYVVNIPADWDSGKEDFLIQTLTQLRLPEDPALQAFLSLPDVSVGADNLLESFQEAFAGTYPNEEAALRALSPLEDWENSLADWCIDHGIDFDALEWNYEPLIARLRDIYDFVEQGGQLHAFTK